MFLKIHSGLGGCNVFGHAFLLFRFLQGARVVLDYCILRCINLVQFVLSLLLGRLLVSWTEK